MINFNSAIIKTPRVETGAFFMIISNVPESSGSRAGYVSNIPAPRLRVDGWVLPNNLEQLHIYLPAIAIPDQSKWRSQMGADQWRARLFLRETPIAHEHVVCGPASQ